MTPSRPIVDVHAHATVPEAEALRPMWCDSLVSTSQAQEPLVEPVGADRVMLGTDYPVDMDRSDPLEGLEATLLGDRTHELIRGRNVVDLPTTGAPSTVGPVRGIPTVAPSDY